MTLLEFIAVFAVSMAMSELLVIMALWRSHVRCYEYATARADFTERGCAYSDMATVIALDGKVEEQRTR